MTNGCGWVWQERQTRDWFWIERKGERFFASSWITCADAVRILQGKKRAPETHLEVRDISRFHPVSADAIELLAQAMNESDLWDSR
jgi:hypothetical protein